MSQQQTWFVKFFSAWIDQLRRSLTAAALSCALAIATVEERPTLRKPIPIVAEHTVPPPVFIYFLRAYRVKLV